MINLKEKQAEKLNELNFSLYKMNKKPDGKQNLSIAMMRHGPMNLYTQIMMQALNLHGSNGSTLARPEEVRPSTVVPLAESYRKPERYERTDDKTRVFYQDRQTPKSSPFESEAITSDKKKEQPYRKYDSKYSDKYQKKEDKSKVYGQKSEKEKTKNHYSITSLMDTLKRKATEYFKKDYSADFSKKDEKSLYEKSIHVLSKIYNLVLNKNQKYLKSMSYSERIINQAYNEFNFYPSILNMDNYSEKDSYVNSSTIDQLFEESFEKTMSVHTLTSKDTLEKLVN